MIPDRQAQDALIEIVRQAARAEILPRFRNLETDAVKEKTSAQDLVTEADTAAEIAIRAGVEAAFPEATVIGEEAVSEDPALLDLIADAEMAVIVDPIDGTWNYAKGLSVFGVILAVAHRGETVYGCLYDPLNDDWITAAKGDGAWHGWPDGRRVLLHAARPAAGDALSGFGGIYLFPKEKQRQLAALMPEFERMLSLRCSCHEYRMLAAGHMDFGLSAGLNAWDHAAGHLIHTEAGGFGALLDGTDYAPTLRTGTLLMADSRDGWERLRDRFAFLDD